MGVVASANPIVIPPRAADRPQGDKISAKPQTLTGKLAWKTLKLADGTERKATLRLNTPDGQVIDFSPPADMRKNIAHYEQFIGKTVVVKVMPQQTANTAGQPQKIIQNITLVDAAPKPKS